MLLYNIFRHFTRTFLKKALFMKVIHLISGGDSGGAKTHVLSLLQNLNKTITAQLVCFRDGPFAQEARAMGIPTKICGGNNILRICGAADRIHPAGRLPADPLPRLPRQHDRRSAAQAHRPAGGIHRPQRLQAGLYGPPLRPPHLRHHQRHGLCGGWTTASACPTPWWTC